MAQDTQSGFATVVLLILLAIVLLAGSALYIGNEEKRFTAEDDVQPEAYEPNPGATIGYAGCSNTIETVAGYEAIDGQQMWPPDEGFDGGATEDWADEPTGNRLWKVFDRLANDHPDTNTIWWQLCVPFDDETTADELESAVEQFQAQIPAATVYVSSLAPYENHSCELTGSTGVEQGRQLATQLAEERKRVEQGPEFPTLSTIETIEDDCHLTDATAERFGRVLRNFFENR